MKDVMYITYTYILFSIYMSNMVFDHLLMIRLYVSYESVLANCLRKLVHEKLKDETQISSYFFFIRLRTYTFLVMVSYW